MYRERYNFFSQLLYVSNSSLCIKIMLTVILSSANYKIKNSNYNNKIGKNWKKMKDNFVCKVCAIKYFHPFIYYKIFSSQFNFCTWNFPPIVLKFVINYERAQAPHFVVLMSKERD